MNRLSILALILCSFFCSLAAAAQPDSLPSYEDVYHHFFETYDSDTLGIGARFYLHFARKPSGWSVQLEELKTRKKTVEQPLWDPAQSKWAKLDSPFIPTRHAVDSAAKYPDYASDSPFYALNLYYGYRGWEEDVIRALQPMAAKLTDRRLYQLGRAWSSFADYALWPQQRWQNDALRYDSTWRDHDLPEALIHTYMQRQDSAIAMYGRLATRNPRFATYIGNIEADYSNAYMIAWVMLKMLGREKDARQYIVDSLFDPFILAYYRNELESCARNAIWFASGDDDFCEGLYLQEHDGVRPDVTIISDQYISESRYIRYLTQLLPSSKRLATRLPPGFYKAGRPAWHYLEAPDLPTGDASTRLATIAANWKDKPIEDIRPVKEPLTLSFKSASSGETGRLFTWTPTQNQYLLQADMFFADLFVTNAFRRPVVFSNPTFGLEPYCHLNGLLKEVFPDSASTTASSQACDRVADWLLHHCDYGHLDSLSKYNLMISSQVQNYLYDYFETVSALMMANRLPEGEVLLDKYFNVFPDTLLPFNRQTIALIQWYYFAGEGATGDGLIETLIQRILTDKEEAI
jgi:hypothetical protein